MADLKKNYIDVEKIKKEIIKEVDKKYGIDYKHIINKQIKNSYVCYLAGQSDIRNNLDEAERNSLVGSSIPLFENYIFIKRKIARLITKVILKILRVITINQNCYNRCILSTLIKLNKSVSDAFCESSYNQLDLVLRFAELSTNLNDRLTKLESKANSNFIPHVTKPDEKETSYELEIHNELSRQKIEILRLRNQVERLESSFGVEKDKNGKD